MLELRACSLSYPLVCAPLFVPKVWGGRKLETILGKRLPPGERIGESWEVADLPEGTSKIAAGELQGWTLRGAMEEYAEDIAPNADDGRFPLLVKFIDAEEALSVQVHPDEQACRELFPSARSKHECWLVVHAEPGAAVLHGVKPGVTKSMLEAAVGDDGLLEHLRRVPVQAGDVIYIPAGTVHALLPPVVVLEIQQPSDTTFRLYDHGRIAQPSKPRRLHIREGLQALRINDNTPPKLSWARQRFDWGSFTLLKSGFPFTIERLELSRSVIVGATQGAPTVLVVLDGSLVVSAGDGDAALKAGRSCIIPACIGEFHLHPENGASVVLTSPVSREEQAASAPHKVQQLTRALVA